MFRAYGGNGDGGGGVGGGGTVASNNNKSINRKSELMRSTSVPSSAGSTVINGSGGGPVAWPTKPMSNGSINVTNSNQHIHHGSRNKLNNNQQQPSNAISINNHQFYSILSQNSGNNVIASPVLFKEDHLKGIVML